MKFIVSESVQWFFFLVPNGHIIEKRDFEYTKTTKESVLLWNPHNNLVEDSLVYHNRKEIYDYRRKEGLPTYILEVGALPDTMFIDKGGFLYDSDSYNEKNWNFELDKDKRRQLSRYIRELKRNKSTLLPQKNEKLIIDKKFKKVVFVALQKDKDTVMVKFNDWVNNDDFRENIIPTIAKEYPEYLFIVKNHPVEENKFTKYSSNIICGDEYNYKDILSRSDYSLVVNSGVGLQSMIWGVPCIILGNAFYNFKGINVKARNIKDIIHLLGKEISVDIEKAMRFIYFLKYVFYSDCESGSFPIDVSKGFLKPVKFNTVRIFK